MSFGSAAPALADLLPGEIDGWRARTPDEAYTAANLYDYIDGGAEVYLAFNVERVLARQYEKPGSADIIVDLFDMGSSKDAFGAYHHDMREARAVGIGSESELASGALAFWKDRFFVSIISLSPTEESERAVLNLGRGIADAIREDGAAPDLFGRLPREGLQRKQLHYFHDNTTLQVHYRVGEGNPLRLDRETEGLLARYRRDAPGQESGDARPFTLLLVRYPDAATAEAVHDSLQRAGAFERPDGDDASSRGRGWSGGRVIGPHLAIVRDAPAAVVVEEILEETASMVVGSGTKGGEP